MNSIKPLLGVIVGGLFAIAFAFAAKFGAPIDDTVASVVVMTCIAGGVGTDLIRANARANAAAKQDDDGPF